MTVPSMKIVGIFGRPPARSKRWWAFDVFVALLVGLLSVGDAVTTTWGPWLGVAIVAAQCVPIAVRRIWPVQVFWVALAVAALASLRDTDLVATPAVLVALYTVASTQPRRRTVEAAIAAEALALVVVLTTQLRHFWGAIVLLSGVIAAASALGLYLGTRRAYLVELRDRADRLERERDQQNELAAATERERIAREMHDIVAHHLTVMVALSDGAAAAALTSPDRSAEAMRTVSATGRRALADTRRLLGVLREDGSGERQPVPDLSGLDALVAGVRAAGLPVSYEIQGSARDLPSGVQLTVYRLVQEALTNTMKHGGSGASALVRLRHLPGEIVLDVEDDGAGVRAAPSAGAGRGLAGMRERVHAFGGEVQAGPMTPSGWHVSARLTLDESVST